MISPYRNKILQIRKLNLVFHLIKYSEFIDKTMMGNFISALYFIVSNMTPYILIINYLDKIFYLENKSWIIFLVLGLFTTTTIIHAIILYKVELFHNKNENLQLKNKIYNFDDKLSNILFNLK